MIEQCGDRNPNLKEDIRRFLTTFDRYQDLASELLDAAYGLHLGDGTGQRRRPAKRIDPRERAPTIPRRPTRAVWCSWCFSWCGRGI